MIFKSKKNKRDEKISKSKEIIKREKQKIKEERLKMKKEHSSNQTKSKFKEYLKIFFMGKRRNKEEPISIKEQILSMLYFEIVGFVLCLLVFFALSGGRNYIKLYSELNKLINVYDTITSNYYGDLDKKTMIDNAIESMIQEAGDTYTTYTDKKETTSFLENIDGVYEGIGCTVSTNESGEIYIVDIFDNSPAKSAGLLKNDIILKIDDEDYQEKTSEDMAEYIKNNKKSKIKLNIRRDNEEKEIILIRKKIEIPTVEGKVIKNDGKKIGYIQVSVFSSLTYNQFKTELNKLEKEKIQGLIIDVRSNTGGYLSCVTDITSMFLKKGDIIYQLENNKKLEKIKDKTKESRNYPVAVLINAASASASEILASAIKESYHGYIVGTNSFGKGTVQKTRKLSDGTMIKYTVQKWLTPDGNWINEKGVTPTDFVEYITAEDLELSPDEQIDRQYEKALELITESINNK